MFQCISPTLAMAQGLKLIGNFEVQNIGAHWHNILDSPALDGRFSLLISIAMMFLDSFVLITLTIYVDKVFPGKSLRLVYPYQLRNKWWIAFCSLFLEIQEIFYLKIKQFTMRQDKSCGDTTPPLPPPPLPPHIHHLIIILIEKS